MGGNGLYPKGNEWPSSLSGQELRSTFGVDSEDKGIRSLIILSTVSKYKIYTPKRWWKTQLQGPRNMRKVVTMISELKCQFTMVVGRRELKIQETGCMNIVGKAWKPKWWLDFWGRKKCIPFFNFGSMIESMRRKWGCREIDTQTKCCTWKEPKLGWNAIQISHVGVRNAVTWALTTAS